MGDIDSTSATVSWKPVEPVIVEPITPMELAKNSVGLDVLYEAVIGQKTGASKSSSPQEKCSYRGKECHFRYLRLTCHRHATNSFSLLIFVSVFYLIITT